MLILFTVVSILLLVYLIAGLKLDTFVSFILVSVTLGLVAGMTVSDISISVQKGIGATLGDLILIIGFGAMLGKLVADSGAAQKITDELVRFFGVSRIQWGMMLSGFIIGIPLFYNAGFTIVIPLIFMIASSTGLPLLYIAIPMLSALSVAHGYLPPHPSPAAIASQLHADLGKTLMYGILVAIPAIVISGPIFGRSLRNMKAEPRKDLFNLQPRPQHELPGIGISIVTALLPVVILISTSGIRSVSGLPQQGFVSEIIALIALPWFGMLLSVLFAGFFLGVRRGKSVGEISSSCEEAFKAVAGILLIIAGAGVFKQIMTDSGINNALAELLKYATLSPLILAWFMAAIIRVCVGSATVAGLTTVGILAPTLLAQSVHPELAVLSIGAGSLMFSHLNDGGFWLFKEYFNLSIKDTILSWSLMETIISVVGLLGILLLNALI
ncbi:gluconate:H+ symporter [Dyadobacter psychrotolerans]|uniref:Gluconate transporter n=1 Tax=Dyadobacter psychrotolerans TaxID=2541721 RepID=A0A4R5DYW4_9BACT|nr:gluconate:H+ symporter [Dyadobacter psychrotolerans]TDE17351.1 gluconate transporter [Dyadobacter psychrotolerans]